MKTTIYIKSIMLNKLVRASSALNISKNELISILLSRVINEKCFKAKPFQTVKYQYSYPGIDWIREHIIFEPVFYEKAQDLRRNFKFSVSWFISYAIVRFLDKIVKKITNTKNQDGFMDNYIRNYVYIVRKFGDIQVFITMLGLPEEKYLRSLL